MLASLALCAWGVILGCYFATRAYSAGVKGGETVLVATLAIGTPPWSLAYEFALARTNAPFSLDIFLVGLFVSLVIALAGVYALATSARQPRHARMAIVMAASMVGVDAVTMPWMLEAGPAASTASFAMRPGAGFLALAMTAMLLLVLWASRRILSDSLQKLIEGHNAAQQIDVLTGMARPPLLSADFARRVADEGGEEPLAIVAFGIGNLDDIRNQYGEHIAELTVAAVASHMNAARDPRSIVVYEGNGRFLALGAAGDTSDLEPRLRYILRAYSRGILVETRPVSIDLRMGCSLYPRDGTVAGQLVERAHQALALALADPLDELVFFDHAESEEIRRRAKLANDLRGALDRGELTLFYQPKRHVRGMEITGHEALLRWRHPELGLISPADFIPIAERLGLIVPIGDWVLTEACRTAAQWPEHQHVAVNVSPLQLHQPDFGMRVQSALAAAGLAPGRLELEVTETMVIGDKPAALAALRQIKSLGVTLALDDFGTGYSSIAILRESLFHRVKIDRSLVENVQRDRRAQAILQAVFALGQQLGLAVIAEGVESEWQLAILESVGCEEFQGFLGGLPAPADQIAVFPPHEPKAA